MTSHTIDGSKLKLEALEKQHGVKPRTRGEADLVHEQAITAPEKLTDLDLATLEYFFGVQAAEGARLAREQARDPTPAAVEPEFTAAQLRGLFKDMASKTFEEWFEVHQETLNSLGLLGRMICFMADSNENNKQRNARLDALEARAKAAEALARAINERHAHLLGIYNSREAGINENGLRIKELADRITKVATNFQSFGEPLAAKVTTLVWKVATLDGKLKGATAGDNSGASLEARIAALEAAPRMIYKGTWTAGQTYEAGHGVTWGGSMWIAQKTTTEKPGEGPTGWQLAVKRGSDGKDLR